MTRSTNKFLYVARYSSIDRWSSGGEAFTGKYFKGNDFLLLFDFLDGKPPASKTLQKLKDLGNHYEIFELEGMSKEEQAQIILHRIEQKSNESYTVVLIDLKEFDVIHEEIPCYQLESRLSIGSKNGKKTIYNPSQMRAIRARKKQDKLNNTGCSDIEVEDSEIRNKETHVQSLKDTLIREMESIQGKVTSDSRDPPNKKSNNTSVHSNTPVKDKQSEKNQSDGNVKSGKSNPSRPNKNTATDSTQSIAEQISEGIDALFQDSMDAISGVSVKPEEKNKEKKTPSPHEQKGEEGQHRSEEHQKQEAPKPASPQRPKREPLTKEEQEEKNREISRKTIERSILGSGSTAAAQDIQYSAYENTRAELMNLRIQQFIDSLERAIPELSKKSLEFEHYSKMIITFLISDTAEDFQENWAATEPSKSFKINDQIFRAYKTEALFIQEMSDTLFSDRWAT